MDKAYIDIHNKLKEKLDFLEKAIVNTEVQIRFIHERKLKGLLRLLEERAAYLTKLQEIDQDIKTMTDSGILCNNEIERFKAIIKEKEQQLIRLDQQEWQDAQIERQNIIHDLRRVRAGKNLRNSYDMNWMRVSGVQLNQRG